MRAFTTPCQFTRFVWKWPSRYFHLVCLWPCGHHVVFYRRITGSAILLRLNEGRSVKFICTAAKCSWPLKPSFGKRRHSWRDWTTVISHGVPQFALSGYHCRDYWTRILLQTGLQVPLSGQPYDQTTCHQVFQETILSPSNQSPDRGGLFQPWCREDWSRVSIAWSCNTHHFVKYSLGVEGVERLMDSQLRCISNSPSVRVRALDWRIQRTWVHWSEGIG